MAKRKLTVTTPYGKFTRTTERVYTHAIVVCGRPKGWLEERNSWAVKNSERQVKEYGKVIETGQLPAGYSGSITLADYQRWFDEHSNRLEQLPVKLAEQLSENETAITEKRFRCETWAGRYDLAQKAANRLRKDWALVEIYPVDAES